MAYFPYFFYFLKFFSYLLGKFNKNGYEKCLYRYIRTSFLAVIFIIYAGQLDPCMVFTELIFCHVMNCHIEPCWFLAVCVKMQVIKYKNSL